MKPQLSFFTVECVLALFLGYLVKKLECFLKR